MTVESNTRVTSWLKPKLVQVQYKDNIDIDLTDAVEDYRIYDEFTEGKPVKKLILSGKYTIITSEARTYIQSENKKRSDKIIAEAIVIHSLAQRIFANMYFGIIHRSYPLKVFNSKDDALMWLDNIPTKKMPLILS